MEKLVHLQDIATIHKNSATNGELNTTDCKYIYKRYKIQSFIKK